MCTVCCKATDLHTSTEDRATKFYGAFTEMLSSVVVQPAPPEGDNAHPSVNTYTFTGTEECMQGKDSMLLGSAIIDYICFAKK